MNTSNFDEKKRALAQEIQELGKKQEKKRQANLRLYYLLVLLGFGLSIGAAICGYFEIGKTSAILVMLLAIPTGVEKSFKFGEKRDFHRVLVSECRNLKIALDFSVDGEEKLQIIVAKFQSVITTSAKSLPKGQGMQAVKSLYEELDSKGIIPVSPELLAKSE